MEVNPHWLNAFPSEVQDRWVDIDNCIFDPLDGRMLIVDLDNPSRPPRYATLRTGESREVTPKWIYPVWRGPFVSFAVWLLPRLNPWEFATAETASTLLQVARFWAPSSIDFTIENSAISGPYTRPEMRLLVPSRFGVATDGISVGRLVQVWAKLGEAEAKKQFLAGLAERRLV